MVLFQRFTSCIEVSNKHIFYVSDLIILKVRFIIYLFNRAGGVVSKKNNLFVIGNIMKKNKLLNRIWKYESSKNLWEEITSFFTARSNFGKFSFFFFISSPIYS